MKINSYSFGSMEINGQSYTDDLMIVGTEIKTGWYRKKGHELNPEDLSWIIDRSPEVLIIGTGKSGLVSVPERTREFLNSKNIEFEMDKTGEAVNLFNAKIQDRDRASKVGGVFHLTC